MAQTHETGVVQTHQPEESDGKRVCVFTTAHDTTDSRVVEREVASLDDAGHDVTYYTPFEGDGPVGVVSYDDAEEGAIPSIGTRIAEAARVTAALWNTDYDVYHFHDVEALPAGVLLGARTDGTVVYDVHENVEATLRHKPIFPAPLRPLVATAASVVERTLTRFVDEVVAASPDVAERFEDVADPTVVTNYPRRRWAEGTNPDEHITPGDGPTRIVYRGLLSEDRGILTLLDAVEQIPDDYDVELSIGGKYDSDAARERIEPRIEAVERAEFVEWFPSLEGMIEHFRDADLGAMCFHPAPNKTDAVHRSNKIFQYMSAGLPVVVSDIGNWGKLVTAEGCGVPVEPEDPAAVTDTIVDLIDDPDRRAELGRNGHRAALERYNWAAQREKLLAVYEDDEVEDLAPTREHVERADRSHPTDD
ncbi:glycosyltransferase [Halosimplex salinum]|uniref:glycosyltransferase n=1 Tax=Halosimplex salinum TaxID=1710538 RepID=UPI000F474121|nr:glycosyltransferase [Halosimplex salinum]